MYIAAMHVENTVLYLLIVLIIVTILMTVVIEHFHHGCFDFCLAEATFVMATSALGLATYQILDWPR